MQRSQVVSQILNAMTVEEAIAAAEVLLPGHEAPALDPRWQAIIAVGEFVETEPEACFAGFRTSSSIA